MSLSCLFLFKAAPTQRNRAYFETILEWAGDIPPRVIEILHETGLRIDVIDAMTPDDGFSDQVFADGRHYWELPGVFRPKFNRIVLPLLQKSPDTDDWFDVYDFHVKPGPVPKYIHQHPHIRTVGYRKLVLFHEIGHALDLALGLRHKRNFARAHLADENAIVENRVCRTNRLREKLTERAGGYGTRNRALRETLADCFVEMAAPQVRHIDMPQLFPRTLKMYERSYRAITA